MFPASNELGGLHEKACKNREWKTEETVLFLMASSIFHRGRPGPCAAELYSSSTVLQNDEDPEGYTNEVLVGYPCLNIYKLYGS